LGVASPAPGRKGSPPRRSASILWAPLAAAVGRAGLAAARRRGPTIHSRPARGRRILATERCPGGTPLRSSTRIRPSDTSSIRSNTPIRRSSIKIRSSSTSSNPQQYANPQPYRTPPPPQPGYGAAVTQPAPISSSGVTAGAWPGGGRVRSPCRPPRPCRRQPARGALCTALWTAAPQFYPQAGRRLADMSRRRSRSSVRAGPPWSRRPPASPCEIWTLSPEAQRRRRADHVGRGRELRRRPGRNIVLDEQNSTGAAGPPPGKTSATAPPWRGAGEHFRMEAVPRRNCNAHRQLHGALLVD